MKGFLVNLVLYFLSWLIPKLFEHFRKCDAEKAKEMTHDLYDKCVCQQKIDIRDAPMDAGQDNGKGKSGRKIVISSGHGSRIAGAVGILNEVDEARRVVNRVAELLRERGHEALIFHDDVSTTEAQNIATITAFHRDAQRDRDVSIHFNSFGDPQANGVETLYRQPSDEQWASSVSVAIAKAGGMTVRWPQGGATMRGAWRRDNLGFLNNLTALPTILVEVCFVSSQRDVDSYRANFERICSELADALVA